jgi:large subunit ribosomal protein L21
MYAVIRTGAGQERVEQGQRLRVDLRPEDVGEKITFEPVLIVDGDLVLSTPEQLAKASVTANVVGDEKGPKINALTYKAKANQRKRWGHRQKYSTVEITGISAKA